MTERALAAPGPVVLVAAAFASVIAGCTGPTEFVTLEHVGTRVFDRTYFVPNEVNVGGGRDLMRSTDEIITHVEYGLQPDRRFYVFDGDVEEGIELASFALLPPLVTGTSSRRELIFQFTTPQLQREWQSFRVYDVGACGGFVSWDSLANMLVPEIDAFALNSSAFREAVRTTPAVLSPHIATAGSAVPRLEDGDFLRLTVSYEGQPLACDNRVTLNICSRSSCSASQGSSAARHTTHRRLRSGIPRRASRRGRARRARRTTATTSTSSRCSCGTR